MKKALLIFLLCIPLVTCAQSFIIGKVINSADNKPVPYASVFLSNSVIGTKTGDDGIFTLKNVRAGQYNLVISFIGFETHHQPVIAGSNTIELGNIVITPKNTQLKEVKIAPDPNRNENLALFIKIFLGQSDNANDCKVLNPDVINIRYDRATRSLNANSDDFILIANKALGYRIHYLLSGFTKDYNQNSVTYQGSVLFEEMDGKPSQKRKWLKKRLEVYSGSDMHFLRSVFADNVEGEGFAARRLTRKPNTARPPDSLIRARIRLFAIVSPDLPHSRDSANYWNEKYKLPKTMEFLTREPYKLKDYVKRTDNKAMLALQYPDYLYVTYNKKTTDAYGPVYHPIDMKPYPTSIIDLAAAYAVFDSNGVFIDPASTIYEGEWAKHGVADLLPFDYDPKTIQ